MTTAEFDNQSSLLYAEIDLLRKLLYRNEKQHGKTKIFSYFKAITRQFSTLTRERLILVQQKASETNFQIHLRISESGTVDQICSLRGLQLACRALQKVDHLNQSALLCLTGQLRRRVFTPLYSLLLALAARLQSCVRALLGPLLEAFGTIRGRLQVS